MHKSTRKMLFERLFFVCVFRMGNETWPNVAPCVASSQSINQSINQNQTINQCSFKCYINISCVPSFSNFLLVAVTYLIEYHITNYKRTLGFRERTKFSSSSESSQTKGLM